MNWPKTSSFLALLLLLLSCGKKESATATLEISRGFAITNPNFGGGLIITGKSDAGQEFSMSLTTGTSLNLVLTKSTWVIKAVAWDGGKSPEKLFAGIPYCGVTVKPLTMDNELIDLVVTREKCLDPIFIAGNTNFIDDSTTPNTLKRLGRVNTCGSFLLPSTPIIEHSTKLKDILIKDATLDTACDNAKIPLDFRSQVRAIKIRTLEKKPLEPELKSGRESGCIAATGETSSIDTQDASSSYLGYDIRLPVSSVPFIIETFSDVSCQKLVADYWFKTGLADNYSAHFDHLLFPCTEYAKLWLPGNNSKRGKSPFLAAMPILMKNGYNTPVRFPTGPSANSRHFHGITGPTNKVIIDVPSCPITNAGGLPVSGTVSFAKCTDLGEKVQVTFTGEGQGIGTFSLKSTYNVYISDDDLPRYLSQSALIELLGNSNTDMASTFYKKRPVPFADVDESYGALSMARHFLGPKGAGIFNIPDQNIIGNPDSTFEDYCTELVGTQEKIVFNPKTLSLDKWVYVVSNDTTKGPTSFTCSNVDLSTTNCVGKNFSKRMKVYNYAHSLEVPVAAFEFNCNGPHGRAEFNAPFEEFGTKTLVREVQHWNTWWGKSGSGLQRFERLIWDSVEEKTVSGWVLKEERRSMARIQKTGSADWNARIFDYRTYWNSTWVQRIDNFLMGSNSTAGSMLYYKVNSAMAADTKDPLSVMTDPLASAPYALTANAGFNIGGEWPMTITYLTSTPIPLLNPVVRDVDEDNMDDNGADKFDGDLPMQSDAMGADFLGKFGSSFLIK